MGIDVKSSADSYTFINDDKNILKWSINSHNDLCWQIINTSKNELSSFYVNNDNILYDTLEQLFEQFKNGILYTNETELNVNCSHKNNSYRTKEIIKQIYKEYDAEPYIIWYSDEKDKYNDYVGIKKLLAGYLIIISSNNIKNPKVLFATNGNSLYEYGFLPFMQAFRNIKKYDKVKKITN